MRHMTGRYWKDVWSLSPGMSISRVILTSRLKTNSQKHLQHVTDANIQGLTTCGGLVVMSVSWITYSMVQSSNTQHRIGVLRILGGQTWPNHRGGDNKDGMFSVKI